MGVDPNRPDQSEGRGRRSGRVTGGQDRRSYIRVEFSVPVVLRVLGSTAEITGKTVNASARGAMVRVPDVGILQTGSKLDIGIQGASRPWKSFRWLRGTGRVIWVEPVTQAGPPGSPEQHIMLGLGFDGPLKVES